MYGEDDWLEARYEDLNDSEAPEMDEGTDYLDDYYDEEM